MIEKREAGIVATLKDNVQVHNRYELIAALVKDIGFPAVVCTALLYGLWTFGDRTTRGYIETLSVVQDSITKQSTALERVSNLLEKVTDDSIEKTLLLREIAEEQKKTHQAILELKQ